MKRLVMLIAVFSVLLAGCAPSSKAERSEKSADVSKKKNLEYAGFKLTSPAFEDGGEIPVKYCMNQITGGKNVSPPLKWTDPPQGTKSFALVCIDTHPIANGWLHWVVVNIPPQYRELKEGASGSSLMNGALELKNTFGFKGWGGPMPPEGSGVHNYEFHLFAMKEEKIPLPTVPRVNQKFVDYLRENALAETVLTATYKR